MTLSKMWQKFICLHEWETINEATIDSGLEKVFNNSPHAERIMERLDNIKAPHSFGQSVHAVTLCCDKCGKIKHIETISP